ncbi:MAG: GTPase HflX [Gammaproteobacteria bacterium]|nr:GTPase HflX [Gammaproteobacteria bacterium]
MFERPQSGEKAVLVHIDVGARSDPDEMSEFRELAVSAGAVPLEIVMGSRQVPEPKFYVGRGKTAEIKELVDRVGAELVIFNQALSPAQERNLEREFQCRVVDRTGLILDIFAQRARSFEGKLQVELAQLRHLSTRLVRGWTHLERQKGGIGLRGPGETQLETDRRLINRRISQIGRRLEKVEGQRNLGRKSRHKAEVPTISLVGYTNAGKSTLFNRITDSSVYAADKLFATLDPTLRRLSLDEVQNVVLADTVGFIANLPHELVAAFRSTLQETSEAALLLHVIDADSHNREACITEVNDVLRQIGASQIPQLQVFNKIDLLEDCGPKIERDRDGMVHRVWISAATGEGIDLLLQALGEVFQQERVQRSVHLNAADGRLRARLFELGRVVQETVTAEGGWELKVVLPRKVYEQLIQQEPDLEDHLVA